MTTPSVGARVRVVVEGEVSGRGDRWFILGGRTTLCPDDPGVTVEVLPPPEPEWRPGDVALAKHDTLLVRCQDNDGWITVSSRLITADHKCRAESFVFGEYPTLIARDGKPVTP